ncbi:hypothetical protein B0H13DRAFT_916103 [Mycena leptocephala]|nr:hypothetical protein B0H13DRAFT_916103 [Mycena leptocephala]
MPIESIPVSDNDRLIAVLQTCFSELIKKQEDQGDRLHRAMEALKTQVPATDKKTSFWNSYMKLADEHDKEFQQKYSTDLDTALIFAGLFSAVSSAFIIQIQPQLMVSNPLTIILVAQSMLYISLLTTLLAALLAVLGKQWIMYYQAAGSRGTIEERGLERQRKLDGMVKWKFDALLQMFPLLLQLALLLFSTSLAIYLWTIHHSIAILVMALTSLGFAAYFFLLLSAIIFPDCPFQTPLAPFLIHIISPCLRTLQPILHKLQRAIWNVQSSFTRFSDTENHLLPRFVTNICLPNPFSPNDGHISSYLFLTGITRGTRHSWVLGPRPTPK